MKREEINKEKYDEKKKSNQKQRDSHPTYLITKNTIKPITTTTITKTAIHIGRQQSHSYLSHFIPLCRKVPRVGRVHGLWTVLGKEPTDGGCRHCLALPAHSAFLPPFTESSDPEMAFVSTPLPLSPWMEPDSKEPWVEGVVGWVADSCSSPAAAASRRSPMIPQQL